jgi:enoyl-CoA hydratase
VFGAPELYASSPGVAPIQAHRGQIDRLFAFDTVEEIVAALGAEGSDWALAQLAILETKSPQALKVSLRAMRLGAKATSFAEEMAREYRLGGNVVRTHDFQEGVRAVIVDKDNAPKWSPSRLAAMTEPALDALFETEPPEGAWTPLADLG